MSCCCWAVMCERARTGQEVGRRANKCHCCNWQTRCNSRNEWAMRRGECDKWRCRCLHALLVSNCVFQRPGTGARWERQGGRIAPSTPQQQLMTSFAFLEDLSSIRCGQAQGVGRTEWLMVRENRIAMPSSSVQSTRGLLLPPSHDLFLANSIIPLSVHLEIKNRLLLLISFCKWWWSRRRNQIRNTYELMKKKSFFISRATKIYLFVHFFAEWKKKYVNFFKNIFRLFIFLFLWCFLYYSATGSAVRRHHLNRLCMEYRKSSLSNPIAGR